MTTTPSRPDGSAFQPSDQGLGIDCYPGAGRPSGMIHLFGHSSQLHESFSSFFFCYLQARRLDQDRVLVTDIIFLLLHTPFFFYLTALSLRAVLSFLLDFSFPDIICYKANKHSETQTNQDPSYLYYL
jgi:hypothetical protein